MSDPNFDATAAKLMAENNCDALAAEMMMQYECLTQLMEKAPDEQLDELEAKGKELSKQIKRLIDKNLDSATAEYINAKNELRNASKDIHKALEDTDQVTAAIATVARVIDLAAKIAV